ncbi:hypothetical protein [Teichococcus oryzae]|uniref:Uncharacterized protein n=1 Tax=Teichococcus oryzae TaxID=1608942 RepID=A0A5B2THX2_9PROT|nr:hypothetical protein [Pseudoroseomonas oryzae]KAA2213538.1 hypothetical protein F0Q34_09925 [Pseudoroseomonas oryzae]
MSEYFPNSALRELWYARRAVLLAALRDAVATVAEQGAEFREINGWAAWARLGRHAVDVTTSMPFSNAATMPVLLRCSRSDGFGPRKPSCREIELGFEPGGDRLTTAGQQALADITQAFLRMLREGPATGTARRGPRNPTRKAMQARGAFAKAMAG